MIKQFEISTSVQKQLGDYLAANQTDLKTAMADETRNGEVAAIIHASREYHRWLPILRMFFRHPLHQFR